MIRRVFRVRNLRVRFFGSCSTGCSRVETRFIGLALFEGEKNHSIFRIPNNDNNVVLNYFLQAILKSDTLRCRELLARFKGRVEVNQSRQNTNLYVSCLNIYVSHLKAQKGLINIHDVKLALAHSNLALQHEFVPEIKLKLACCLGYAVVNAQDKTMKYNISLYMNTMLEKWDLSAAEIRAFAQETDAKMVDSVFPASTKVDAFPAKFEANDLEVLTKTGGNFSFGEVCDYITTRFAFGSQGNDEPLYKLYDQLPESDKVQFEQNYSKFNEKKQLVIESHCLNLSGDWKAFDSMRFSRFKNSQVELIYTWFQQITKYLTHLGLKFQHCTMESLEQEERVIFKYRIYLDLVSKRDLVTIIINVLISKTLCSESGYAKLMDVVRESDRLFRRIVVTNSKDKPTSKLFVDIFDEEDSVAYFSALFKATIKLAKVPASTINQKEFQTSLTFINEAHSIDPSFLNCDNSGYPAFIWGTLTNYQNISYKKVGVVKIHPYLFSKFRQHDSLFHSRSIYFPMLHRPQPWTSPVTGGYLTNLKPIINSDDLDTSLKYLNRAHGTGQLSSIYQGLNVLGSTAWAINPDVIKVFNQVMEFEDGFLKIPKKISHASLKAPSVPRLFAYDSPEEYKEAFQKYKIEKELILKEFHELKAQRVELRLLQRLAKAFNQNGDVFYLPHNLDFRGRAYPMVSLLSHYQSDVVRSLLMFWYSKPLGKNGFNWLKYQLAGVYGQDKLSMEERLRFVDENLDLVINSAKDPLGGKMWWKNGEKPWQSLALCIEIEKVLQYSKVEGNNIENFLCRIPIHQDGSCNGLQHYAALGADKEAGISVNLLPDDSGEAKRNDVYLKVLELVKLSLKQAATSGNNNLAKLALPIISRKVIKQTVMTNVYGVTRHGATDQIHERLKELIKLFEVRFSDGHEIPLTSTQLESLKQRKMEVAYYLAGVVLSSISKLFASAKQIQDWLVENCFRMISSYDVNTIQSLQKFKPNYQVDFLDRKFYKLMMWTSSSGFPVVQLYRHVKQKNVSTVLQSLKINKPACWATTDIRKQLNGVAPNFIHSIDSIHMLMTCLQAHRRDMHFAAVHDSFWTLPCDVDDLSAIIRQEFVTLYSSGILENLQQDFSGTIKTSFQLVYFDRDANPQLFQQVQKLRSSYTLKSTKRKKEMLNRTLAHELVIQSKNIEGTPTELIERYRPTLYYLFKQKPGALKVYGTSNTSEKYAGASNSLTPILVPVRMLDLPKTGELDINQVLKSKYFFS